MTLGHYPMLQFPAAGSGRLSTSRFYRGYGAPLPLEKSSDLGRSAWLPGGCIADRQCPLQLMLWWRGVRPAAEDWTDFFNPTPLSNDCELLGQMGQAIAAHAYPATVWSPGEVVEDQVQISAANLQAGRYAVWMGLYSSATQVRVSVEAGAGEVIEDCARLLEFQIGP